MRIIYCLVLNLKNWFCYRLKPFLFRIHEGISVSSYLTAVVGKVFMKNFSNDIVWDIYPSSFTNARFWTKIELSNILFHDKRSKNYSKMQVGICRCCKLRNWSIEEPWWGSGGKGSDQFWSFYIRSIVCIGVSISPPPHKNTPLFYQPPLPLKSANCPIPLF